MVVGRPSPRPLSLYRGGQNSITEPTARLYLSATEAGTPVSGVRLDFLKDEEIIAGRGPSPGNSRLGPLED